MQLPEERSEQRFLVNWPLQVRRTHRRWTNCKIVDVSATGLMFVSAEHYRVDEALQLEIAIRPTVLVPCVARVVREVSNSGRCFRYAATFKDFAVDGRRLLRDTLWAIRRRSRAYTATAEVVSAASSRLANVRLAEPATSIDIHPPRRPIVVRRMR